MSAEHRQERLEQQSGRTIAGRVFLADGDKGVLWRESVVVEESDLATATRACRERVVREMN